ATAVFSPHAPDTQSWSAPGTITYNILSWCRYIDIILVGGGNGGGGGFAGFVTGGGGNAGTWTHITIERG
ncbi:glycine-rich domain-containing protein, partial [Mycobacteroides abscessus]